MSTTTTKQESKNEAKNDRPVIVPVIKPGRGYGGPGVVVLALVMALLGWVMPAGAQEAGTTGPYGERLSTDPADTIEQLERESAWLPEHLGEIQAEKARLEEALSRMNQGVGAGSGTASSSGSHGPPPTLEAPVPMTRSETVAQTPAKPPRFTGRSVIHEVAYGLEEAVVECVAFRVCAIFLEPGERIVDRNLGDVDRWNYRESYAGPAGVETPVVAVQPLDFDLETNLLLFTDRRVYRARLLGLAKPKEGSTVAFTEALSFRYPKQEMQIAEPPPRSSSAPGAPAGGGSSPGDPALGVSPGSLDFGYRIEEPRWRLDRFRWEPTAVFDDGERVFVYLPEVAFLDDAPLLVGLDAEDEPVQVNATLERDPRTGRRYFAVPRLVGSLELFVGQGDSRRWLRIHRNGPLGSGE